MKVFRTVLLSISGVVLLVASVFLAMNMLGLVGRFQSAYYKAQWSAKRPSAYYMEFTVFDLGDEWRWAVVVQENEAVSISLLDGSAHDTWFDGYDFTIEGILDAGVQFCFEDSSCLIRIDETYAYPQLLAISSRAVRIDVFQPCEASEDCGFQQ